MNKRQFFFPLLLAAVVGCCCANHSVVSITTSAGSKVTVSVELADTEEERERGLMFRTGLVEGAGMLFLFPTETETSFWMKDTPISLDMIFVKNGRVVDLIENAVPYSKSLLTPSTTYQMVLEVPGGYASKTGIKIGDLFEYP